MKLLRLVRVLKAKDPVAYWFTFKTLVVGTAVYTTYQKGIWMKTEESTKLAEENYTKLYNVVTPYVKPYISEDIVKEWSHLPSLSCIKRSMNNYWNKGVFTSMNFLSNLPTHTMNGALSLYNIVEEHVKDNN